MTDQPPAPKLSPAAWRKTLAGIASLIATGSAMSATGATVNDWEPLLDKGGWVGGCAIFAYLGWTQIVGMLGAFFQNVVTELRAIRDRIADMGTKQADMHAKQELHDARLNSVDSKLASFDRRLEDIQTTLAATKATR